MFVYSMSMDAVDGSWGAWSEWTACTLSCGGGTRLRTRGCDSPAPSDNGRYCAGSDRQLDYCNRDHCPSTQSHSLGASADADTDYRYYTVTQNKGIDFLLCASFFKHLTETGEFFSHTLGLRKVPCVPQNVHLLIFLNKPVKNEPILIIFGMLNPEII